MSLGEFEFSFFDVELDGVTSIIQHRFTEAGEVESGTGKGKKTTRSVNKDYGTPREQAEKAAYRNPKDKTLWHPGAAIGRMLREVGAYHKQTGSRRSLKYLVPAAVLVMDDEITMLDGKGKALKDFEVDSRPVVIPATKARIMRHRPRHDTWKMKFRIRINTGVLDVPTIRMLMTQGGQMIGLGDFRPEKGGPFGTFDVISFQEVKEKTRSKKTA